MKRYFAFSIMIFWLGAVVAKNNQAAIFTKTLESFVYRSSTFDSLWIEGEMMVVEIEEFEYGYLLQVVYDNHYYVIVSLTNNEVPDCKEEVSVGKVYNFMVTKYFEKDKIPNNVSMPISVKGVEVLVPMIMGCNVFIPLNLKGLCIAQIPPTTN